MNYLIPSNIRIIIEYNEILVFLLAGIAYACSEYAVTEIHLEGEEKMSFVNSDCVNSYEQTSDERYMASDTRLVIRTNKKLER